MGEVHTSTAQNAAVESAKLAQAACDFTNELVAELSHQRSEIARMRQDAIQVQEATQRTFEILSRVTADLPPSEGRG